MKTGRKLEHKTEAQAFEALESAVRKFVNRAEWVNPYSIAGPQYRARVNELRVPLAELRLARKGTPWTQQEPVLCFVREPWAYFTTQPLEKQWGDDWNDAPYEHNAGEPYLFSKHDEEQCREPWEITKVAYEGLENPSSNCNNSSFSVEQINRGITAWLYTSCWSSGPQAAIFAGTTLSEFIKLVHQSEGEVYVKVNL